MQVAILCLDEVFKRQMKNTVALQMLALSWNVCFELRVLSFLQGVSSPNHCAVMDWIGESFGLFGGLFLKLR